MEFNCPNCKLAGSIDDAKLPEEGRYAVCPKCKERFLVKREVVGSTPREPTKKEIPVAVGVTDVDTPAQRDAADESRARQSHDERPFTGQGARPAAATAFRDSMATFIGRNHVKYQRKFEKFNSGGSGGFALTWHWPAFFVPFWWLLYRKQYAWAVLAFIVSLIPFAGFLSMFAFGLTGNYIYYSYAHKKLREIQQLPTEMSRAVEMTRAGGVNNIALVLVPLFGIVFIGIVAAVAIPQFASYRMKSYNATAITELRNVKTSVESYYAEHGVYPDSLEQINCPRNKDVDVHFSEIAPNKYTIVAAHLHGDKEYATKSDTPDLLCRSNKEKDSEFVPMK